MKKTDIDVINEVSRDMYQIAFEHGFHKDSPSLDSGEEATVDRVAKFCANLHGEVSELWEAARKGNLNAQCDKDGCFMTCAEEELADLAIRLMDTAVVLRVDLGKAIFNKSEFNRSRSFMHGKRA
jgi:NTP pyrophosphatase (non-canonical NTP hydrolase)